MLLVPDYVVWQNVEGELALFDSREGRYHALNETASAVWRALAAGDGADQVIDRLAADHDAPRAALETAVRIFIANAQSKGLLIAADAT